MVGIVIGVWTVIGMVALVTGFDRSQTEAFSAFGTTLVQFQKFEPRFGPGRRSEEERKRKDLTIEDADALQELCPSILAVSPERYLWAASQVKGNGNEANSPTISGGNQNYAICNNYAIQDGRNLTELDVLHATDTCVVGQDVSEALFKGKDPPGQVISVNGKRLQIIGTFGKRPPRAGDRAQRPAAPNHRHVREAGLPALRRPARQHHRDAALDVRPPL